MAIKLNLEPLGFLFCQPLVFVFADDKWPFTIHEYRTAVNTFLVSLSSNLKPGYSKGYCN